MRRLNILRTQFRKGEKPQHTRRRQNQLALLEKHIRRHGGDIATTEYK